MPEHRVLDSPCYVVSDHHIGAVPDQAELDFVEFLDSIRGKAASLVINGDLFDFWFEWRSVMPRTGFRVLAALATLVRESVPVLWIGGNHDCWGGEILRRDVGVHYQLGVWTGEIAGWRAEVEHGDGLRREADRRYRALRAVIRHPLAIAGMRLLHPDVGVWLATRSSSASREYRARDGGAALRDVAFRRLQGDAGPDLYILGHSHVPVVERLHEQRVYANAGSFSDGGSYLVITRDRVELRSRSRSSGDHGLDSVDR